MGFVVVKVAVGLFFFFWTSRAIKISLLRAFAKLRKSTVSFVMPVCLSFRMERLGCHWTDFDELDI
jgi:hypothetical protein